MPSNVCCNWTISRAATTGLLLGLLAMASGCQVAHEAHPLPPALFADDPDTQLDFWHTLTERKITTNDEAFHGLLLYLDGKDGSRSYTDRVQALKSRKLISAGFNAPADHAVTRGALAVALVKTLQIKGGLTMRIFGPNERYAVRELQYMGLYPLSSPQQTFSGTEFVGIIGKIDDYQTGQAKPAATGQGL